MRCEDYALPLDEGRLMGDPFSSGKADALVTGDKDLLSLAGSLACPILSADQFLRKFILDR